MCIGKRTFERPKSFKQRTIKQTTNEQHKTIDEPLLNNVTSSLKANDDENTAYKRKNVKESNWTWNNEQ